MGNCQPRASAWRHQPWPRLYRPFGPEIAQEIWPSGGKVNGLGHAEFSYPRNLRNPWSNVLRIMLSIGPLHAIVAHHQNIELRPQVAIQRLFGMANDWLVFVEGGVEDQGDRG